MTAIFKFKSDKSYYEVEINDIIDYLKERWSPYALQKVYLDICKRENLIPDNNYVICPLYGDEKDGTFDDFQFGATETYKKGENDLSAFYRCLGEEIGVYYNSDRPPKSFYFPFKGKKYNGLLNVVNIKDVEILKKSRPDDKRGEDRNRKMATVVHGKKQDMFDYLDNVLTFDVSNDTIVGMVIIQFKFIKETFKLKPMRKT